MLIEVWHIINRDKGVRFVFEFFGNHLELHKHLAPSGAIGLDNPHGASRRVAFNPLNKIYLEKANLDVELLGQGFTWLDTGTHESLVDATNFVKTVETHQNRKIACLEEIAYNNGWISKDELNTAYELYKKNQYGKYLKDVMDGKFIDQ